MVTGPAFGDVVHQIVVSTDQSAGASLLASSLTSTAEEGFWLAALRFRAPLARAPGLFRPDRAMTFVQLRSGGAAVIRRVDRKAHALIGRARVLNTETALALDEWPGWLSRGPYEPVPEADLQRAADGMGAQLLRRVSQVQPSLVTAVAVLIGRWTAPVTIVGCPDEDRVALVWALRQIGRRRRERRAMRQWTYSTYELSDEDPVGAQPFEIVFLPAHPGESSGRVIVDLSPYGLRRHGSDLSLDWHAAEAVVNEFLDGAPEDHGLSILDPDDEPAADDAPAESAPAESAPAPEPPFEVDAPTVPVFAGVPAPPVQAYPTLRCPTCADEIPWVDDGWISIWAGDDKGYELFDTRGMDALKRRDVLRRGYRRCPNPSQDTPEHFLPATYADYADPLVIGLVGLTYSGKTHLLTAMLRDAYRGGLQPFGLQATSLDMQRHSWFRKRFVDRFDGGDVLPGTGVDVVDAADILLLRGPNGARTVTFFDVAGEALANQNVKRRDARFLLGVNAVIFVHALGDPDDVGTAEGRENSAFDLAMERIDAARDGDTAIPAAIVLTKCDRLRFVPPIDRWLRRGSERDIDARRIRAESRDAFAYLHTTGARSALGPYSTFPRCTLHFASASGGDAGEGRSGRFPLGVRPMRALEPLIAILAMSGVLTGVEAEKVGAP